MRIRIMVAIPQRLESTHVRSARFFSKRKALFYLLKQCNLTLLELKFVLLGSKQSAGIENLKNLLLQKQTAKIAFRASAP